jgi:hypothetical protein
MYICRDCGNPVTVTWNPERQTPPLWHVSCASCPAERDEAIEIAPVLTGNQAV